MEPSEGQYATSKPSKKQTLTWDFIFPDWGAPMIGVSNFDRAVLSPYNHEQMGSESCYFSFTSATRPFVSCA